MSAKDGCSAVDLSIVIVNFNSGGWLHECLRSIRQHVQDVSYEVIVVDNGSTDGSLLGIPERYPDVKIIRNRTNRGFAAAANQGIQASRGSYILLINPDAALLNDEITTWLRYMDEHPEVGISGPKVYDDATKQSIQLSCRRFPSYWSAFFGRYSPLTRLFPGNRFSREFLMSDWDRSEIREVDWVSGCCMLLRREMLNAVGMLDEGYPLFFEDVDLCYRAHQAGWKVVYFPIVEVAHHIGKSRAQAPYRTIVERHLSLWRFYRKLYARSPLEQIVIFTGILTRMVALLGAAALKRTFPLLLDGALIQLGIVLSYLTRSLWVFPWFERAVHSYLSIAVWYTLMQLFLLYMFDLYNRARSRYYDYLDILPQVIKAISTGTLMFVFIAFFARQFVLPRSIVLLSWIFNVLLLAGWRWLALYLEQKRRPLKRVLIYGTGPLAELVGDELRRRISLRCELVGFVRPKSDGQGASVAPVLGTLEDLEELIRRRRIDEVIFAPEERSDEELQEVLERCRSTQVNTRIAPELFEIAMGAAYVAHLQVPLLDPVALPARSGYLHIKRLIDVLIAGALLVGLAPLMGLIALGVKLSSPGPVLFRQRRVGFQGREFMLYKFRTMREASSEEEEEELEEDPSRMTPFGRFLRITRLDELPQVYNVLKGEMSLVGPRAEWVKLARQMEREIPFFELRYLVRPGMTGWAQVEYKYTTSVEEYRKKFQYDLYYVKNVSFALDLKILLKTLWVVLTGKGAR